MANPESWVLGNLFDAVAKNSLDEGEFFFNPAKPYFVSRSWLAKMLHSMQKADTGDISACVPSGQEQGKTIQK